VPGGKLAAGTKAKLFFRWEAELGGNMVGYYKSDGDADDNGKKPM
jgi:aminopeptidase 2